MTTTVEAEALREAWRKFDKGDHLTDAELRTLKRSAEEGERYLVARGERLATAKTRLDLSRIEGYLDARRTR